MITIILYGLYNYFKNSKCWLFFANYLNIVLLKIKITNK